MVGLPVSAEQELLKVMDTVRNMNKNPLRFTYVLSRSKPDTGFMKYHVTIGVEQTDEQLHKILEITSNEKDLIKEMKGNEEVMKGDSTQKLNVLISNNVIQDRAKALLELFAYLPY